jgi:hypothetical protein
MSDDARSGIVSELVQDTFGPILNGKDKDREHESPKPEPMRSFPTFPADLGTLPVRRAALGLALWDHAAGSLSQHGGYPPRSETVVKTAETFEAYLRKGDDGAGTHRQGR